MALYSLIQFTSVGILYTITTSLADYQFVYIDLVTVFPLAISMSYTNAANELRGRRPEGTLISFNILMSLVGATLFQAAALLISLELLRTQKWFTPTDPDDFKSPHGDENTLIFSISNVLYVAICLAFNSDSTYRKPFYNNMAFTLTLIALGIAAGYLILLPARFIRDLLSLVEFPFAFRIVLLVFSGGVVVSLLIFERSIVNWTTAIWRKLRECTRR
jgi:cation-transporting ATPase 13A3/4/5